MKMLRYGVSASVNPTPHNQRKAFADRVSLYDLWSGLNFEVNEEGEA